MDLKISKNKRPLIDIIKNCFSLQKKDFKENNHYIFTNTNRNLPNHGWKIHVSASYLNYKEITNITIPFCLKSKIDFKIIKNDKLFLINISKIEDMKNSGKYITIYPKDKKQFISVLDSLYLILYKKNGPKVLTDKNYKDSKIISYRYGIIIPNSDPNKKEYYSDPNGKLILDERKIPFSLPWFIKDPFEFSSKNVSFDFKKFVLKGYISYNNGGGVYLLQKNNYFFILKESREWIGINKNYNMISLRKNEKKIMLRINSNKYTPKFVDDFYKEGNYYLIKSYVRGINLKTKLENEKIYFFNNDKIVMNFLNFLKNTLVNLVTITNYLHAKKIILNDYKLTNFLFCPIKNKLFFIDLDNSYIFGKQKINVYDYSFKKIVKKWTDYRKDFHKLGLMILKHLLFDIHYRAFDKTGEKNLLLLKIIWEFYSLPSDLFQVIFDLIYKEKINAKSVKKKLLEIKLENYNFVNKKLINLPEVLELNNFFLKNWEFQDCEDFKITDFMNESSFYKLYSLFIQNKFLQENLNDLSKIEWILEKSNLSEVNSEIVEEWYETIFLNIVFGKNINEKIIDEFIIKFIKEVNGMSIIKNKKESDFLSPNFKNGTAGLIYLLIIFSEKNHNNKYLSLIKKLLKSITFNFSQKTSFFDGNAGYGYVFLKAYKLFNDKEYYFEALNKIFMIKFNWIKNQLYSNNSILKNDDFWSGLEGVYFFIKTFLSIDTNLQNLKLLESKN